MTTTLKLNDVTKNFGGNDVLSGITLELSPGETAAIIGPSGSGKSTLLHCMSGVLLPTTGRVHFGTTDLTELNDGDRSHLRLSSFGFVFQDGQLLPELTAAENIALPATLTGTSRRKARRRAVHLLDQLGLGEFADRRPGPLSGGQAQRVAIARALATEPAVIFADEPTGALDQATGHDVMQMLTTLVRQQGSTLVLVTHDAQVADWLDRRIELRDGIIHDDRQLGAAR
ncbi:ABC transporter ATP-binding protein [Corynebacterium sp. LK2590]|uniref:ABC transporter ATP-binding protein n=1 Tax=unclassified Corynebacterium TaxID=2624378 RepID=UPI0034CF69D7